MPRNGMFVRITLALAAAALLAATVATGASAKRAGVSLTGAGSSFVAPLVQKWITPIGSQLGINFSYAAIGSGGGVGDITNRQVDLGMSDAPLSVFNPTCTTCVQLPWALAGTAVLYHDPGPGLQHIKISGPVLAKIYLGKITHWNDPALKKLNPGKNLPSTAITVVHRSDSSGTTYNFTDYLSRISPTWKSQVGTNTTVAWPVGVGGNHSSGVSAIVSQTPGAIGYADVDYAHVNHLDFFRVENASGNFIIPTLKTIGAAAQLDTKPAADGSLSIVNPPKSAKYKNAYPICTYTYVDAQQDSGTHAVYDKKLLNWAVTTGQSFGPALFFVPLPAPVVAFDKKQIKKIA
ncbi:MAG TPA: phosphate ABC transporter substrate-binding protein PstS [Gaiellaceae bacterium]|nr:phosphate ABC transporter substrate-binding protein PstS [Gaiellaceae bacterium]